MKKGIISLFEGHTNTMYPVKSIKLHIFISSFHEQRQEYEIQ